MTGLSYARVLFGREPAKTHDYHYWVWAWARWDWNRKREVPGGLMLGLRQGKWKLVRDRSDAAWELYDLSMDVGETNNLAAEHPEKRQELIAMAEAAREPMRPQEEPEHHEGHQFN